MTFWDTQRLSQRLPSLLKRGGRGRPPLYLWSVKKNSQGAQEYVYGYKLHLLVDCEYELPIAASISTGNVSEQTRASYVLREARYRYTKFHPRFVMADKGYSGKPFMDLVRRQYKAKPIVDLNRKHKTLLAKNGADMKTLEWKALYSQRVAVERVFSRLKGQRSLNSIRVRRLRKVTVHCYLSLIALQTAFPLPSVALGFGLEQ